MLATLVAPNTETRHILLIYHPKGKYETKTQERYDRIEIRSQNFFWELCKWNLRYRLGNNKPPVTPTRLEQYTAGEKEVINFHTLPYKLSLPVLGWVGWTFGTSSQDFKYRMRSLKPYAMIPAAVAMVTSVVMAMSAVDQRKADGANAAHNAMVQAFKEGRAISSPIIRIGYSEEVFKMSMLFRPKFLLKDGTSIDGSYLPEGIRDYLRVGDVLRYTTTVDPYSKETVMEVRAPDSLDH